MEVPDGNRRWDSPLFVVMETQELPCQGIADTLLRGKQLAPSLATVLPKTATPNAVFELDRITQDVVQAILDAQRGNAMPGDTLAVPHTDELFLLSKTLSESELRRLRRQYIKIAQGRPQNSNALIAKTFVDYLQSNM